MRSKRVSPKRGDLAAGAAKSQIRPRTLVAPAPRTDLSTYLADKILELIEREDMQEGDRLPSTRNLAAQFSVAEPTLRQAMRRLQATGVLDIRHGSGTYVRRRHEPLVIANRRTGQIGGTVLLEIVEARLVIEPHLAELAADRITGAELDSLKTLLDDAEKYLEIDTSPDAGDSGSQVEQALIYFAQVNQTLHNTIAYASGNRVLAEIVQSLTEVYSFEQLGMSLPGHRMKSFRAHCEIVKALERRDGKLAREKMYDHIVGVRVLASHKNTLEDAH